MVTPQLHVHDKASGAWRPFGCAEDLDVDFGMKNRPELVTALLTSCGSPREAEFWWSQTLSVRILSLLRLLAATESIDRLKLMARCRQPTCAERFEFELLMAMLHDSISGDETVQVLLNDGRPVSLRRPNGRDLHQWNSLKLETRSAAIDAMLKSLVVDGQTTPDDEPVLAKALSDLDPLVAFTVSCACPVCRSANEVRVDLEDIVLNRLRQKQRAMLGDIHKLAAHYGWTEPEVLAIPPHRRAHYLAMIEDER